MTVIQKIIYKIRKKIFLIGTKKKFLIRNYGTLKFDNYINNLSSKHEVIKSSDFINSLIIFNTSGVHYREPFVEKGKRIMLFMQMYESINKLTLLKWFF